MGGSVLCSASAPFSVGAVFCGRRAPAAAFGGALAPLGSPRCGGLRRKTVTPKFFAAAVCKITHKEAKVRGGAVPWRSAVGGSVLCSASAPSSVGAVLCGRRAPAATFRRLSAGLPHRGALYPKSSPLAKSSGSSGGAEVLAEPTQALRSACSRRRS